MLRLLNFAIAAVASAQLIIPSSARAVTFDEQEVDQNQFIAVATPLGDRQYDLLIIEQIPGERQCWSESGANPVTVEPLLLNFDFTESCRRSTDSNGYSIRLDGQDYGLDYLLRITERNGELYLVGTSLTNRRQPEIVIGRTYGISDGFTKIQLNSGWKFTRRVYQGKALGHVYFTSDRNLIADASIPLQEELAVPQERDKLAAPPLRAAADQPPAVDSIAIEVPPPEQPSLDASTPPLSSSPLPPPPVPQSLPASNEANAPLEATLGSTEAVDPPPPPSASRRSLSDILQVAPRVYDDRSGELRVSRLPVPQPPTTAATSGGTFKVLVQASGTQASQVRSLYPDAFSTTYHGTPMMQVGVFSNRNSVDKVLQSLEKIGLTGIVSQ